MLYYIHCIANHKFTAGVCEEKWDMVWVDSKDEEERVFFCFFFKVCSIKLHTGRPNKARLYIQCSSESR